MQFACAPKCDSWVNGKPKGWKSGGDASLLYLLPEGGKRSVPVWGGSATEKLGKIPPENIRKRVAWDNQFEKSGGLGE